VATNIFGSALSVETAKFRICKTPTMPVPEAEIEVEDKSLYAKINAYTLLLRWSTLRKTLAPTKTRKVEMFGDMTVK
jgi:hypothetical protein